MRLKETVNKVRIPKEVPGLLSVVFEHSIKETAAKLDYTGPKIPKDMWQEVLSFFRWTYDTTKSESQVRLFVNPVDKTWKAWAFPQEARSSMSAHELDTDDAKKQREQFPLPWIYFGTVHHHCSISAFQSGTDRINEEDQDGIHITIGKMDQANHDLHARFYVNGCYFEPDMSEMWDVGDTIRELLPPSMHDQVARFQMCHKSEAAFPDVWKENLIEKKVTISRFEDNGYVNGKIWDNEKKEWVWPTSHGSSSAQQSKGLATNSPGPMYKTKAQRIQDAVKEFLEDMIADTNVTVSDFTEAVEILNEGIGQGGSGGVILEMIRCAWRNDVDAWDMVQEVIDQTERAMAEYKCECIPTYEDMTHTTSLPQQEQQKQLGDSNGAAQQQDFHREIIY